MEENQCSRQMKNEIMVQQELCEALLRAEGIRYERQADQVLGENAFTVAEDPDAKIYYPWNPAEPEAEDFLADAQAPSIFEGWQDQEINQRANSFLGQIDQLWVVSLQSILVERFAARIPQSWLAAIAQQAEKIVAETQKTVSEASTSLADQLVQCVRDIAPGLAEDDFYVLARPLAVQMRGGVITTVDAFVAQVPQVEWEQLSDVQRARLGLAIARYAIHELQPASEV